MSINEHYKAVECYEAKYNLWKYDKDIQRVKMNLQTGKNMLDHLIFL